MLWETQTENRQAKILMISLKNSIVLIFLTLMITSCSRTRYAAIQFEPQWHVGDYEKNSIVFKDDELYNRVFSNEPRFNEYACMHRLKITELKGLLRRAKLPVKNIVELDEKELEEFNDLNDEIQKKLEISWIK